MVRLPQHVIETIECKIVSRENAAISQKFQVLSAAGPPMFIQVPTRFDFLGNGHRIVLMSDIAAAMGHVQWCIMNGTKEELRLQIDLEDLDPPRIRYQEDIVLDIVLVPQLTTTQQSSPVHTSASVSGASSQESTLLLEPSLQPPVTSIAFSNHGGALPRPVAPTPPESTPSRSFASTPELDTPASTAQSKSLPRTLESTSSRSFSSTGASPQPSPSTASTAFHITKPPPLPSPASLNSSSQASCVVNPRTTAEPTITPHLHPIVDLLSSQLQIHIETIFTNLRASTSAAPPTCETCCRQAYEGLSRRISLLSQTINFAQRSHYAEEISQELTRLTTAHDGNEALKVQLFEVHQLLQSILEGLTVIQNQLKALLVQTYELHEFTVPRLFIVLPKVTRIRDNAFKPFYKQFRVFFLCECDENEIHLAKHEGYDLDKPKEFFERYSSHIVKMMRLVKFGLIASSVVVSALSSSGLIGGIEDVAKKHAFAKMIAGSVLDKTIKHIQQQQGSLGGRADLTSGDMSLNEREPLEGADLRRLQSYLIRNDSEQELANLYRTVTSEGHVKWVCKDHYHRTYGASAVQQLKAVVKQNGGKFFETEGKIVITLSKKQSKDFYEALSEAPGIQELDITLCWDASMSDLRKLEVAINRTNIVGLTVDGTYFKKPLLDLFNHKRRYNPLMQIISNLRIQTMELKSFGNFFRHIRISSSMKAPKLRVLSIETNLSFKEPSHLMRILELYESLVEFRLECNKIDGTFDELIKWVSDFRNLRKVVIWYRNKSLTITVNEGKIKEVEAELSLSTQRYTDGLVQFANRRITKLVLRPTSVTAKMREPLIDVIQDNTRLSEILIHYHSMHALSMIAWIKDARCSTELQRLQLCIAVKPAAHMAHMEEPKCQDVITTIVDFSPTHFDRFDMTSDVILKNLQKRPNMFDSWELLGQYAWSIERLYANSKFGDEVARLLDQGTDRKSPKLKYLELNPRSLTDTGIESLSRVIARSEHLEQFVLTLNNLDEERERSKLGPLLGQHRLELTSLTARGKAPIQWISRIAELCPTRAHMPNMEELHLTFLDDPLLPKDLAQWIANMVSTPPALPPPLNRTSASGSNGCNSNRSSRNSSGPTTCRLLRRIKLKYLRLSTKDWETVINAIDFTELEDLSFELSNFSERELQRLVACIPDTDTTDIPLKSLNLRVAASLDSDTSEFVQELRRKVPCVRIEGHRRLNTSPTNKFIQKF
ncbi:hypothetical protein BGZ65_005235 [Modicella reniformis]|uniref:Uncharacterized protein n=1 Tax=Modicella reniformis TaxID=1440133 RepID=A0A9P6MKL3_9FUNG|nr:hypothetical protein BGZ65_005235 [Modicella reniformis]